MNKDISERKQKLLEDIVDYYNYELIIKDDKVVIDANWLGYSFEYEYANIDEALKDWLSTLEASNDDREEEGFGEFSDWSKEDIDFIKGL